MKNILFIAILIIINIIAIYPSYCKIDPETIVAYWLLDDAQGKIAKDSSANGYDGNITGSKWVGGKFGKALDFDGKTDQVEVPDAEGLDAVPQITVLTWAKYDKDPPQHYAPVGKEPLYRFIISKGGTGHFVLATTANAWYSGGTVASGGGITAGTWHHLAGTYDGKRVRFYVNGKLAGEGPQEISGDILNNGATFTMAKSIANNVDFFAGSVDEVAVFNIALNVTDIMTIMTSGLTKAISGDIAVSNADKLPIQWGLIKNTN